MIFSLVSRISAGLDRVRFWFGQTLHPSRRTQGVDEELQFHLEQCEAAYRAQGLSPAEAHRRARIDFGSVDSTAEDCNRQRPGWWLEALVQDLRYALRIFRRNPAYAVTAVVTLALGIGIASAVFGMADRILFRPLPFAFDDRLVAVGMVQSLEKQEFSLGGFYYDWRDRQKPFEAFASQGPMLRPCDLVERNPAELHCTHAEAGFLPLLGIAPVIGRNFLPEEDRPNGPPAVLISYALWRDHYGRDPKILSRTIEIDGAKLHVVGVLPRDFQLPSLQVPDILLPMALNEAEERRSEPGTPMRTYARLKPGVSLEQARAQMEPLFVQTRDTLVPPELRYDFHLGLRSLRQIETGEARQAAWILLGAVLAVFAIASANVAGLAMARNLARAPELEMRSVLGASRARLLLQALVEAAVLAALGLTAGVALAATLLWLFRRLAPAGLPFARYAGLDLRTLLFAAALALFCTFAIALLTCRRSRTPGLRSARLAGSARHAGLRRILVAAQIAISVVLLTGAGLLLRSFANMLLQPMGMETGSALTAQIALPGYRYNTPQKKSAFYLNLESRMRQMPGIRAVAYTDSIPPGGWNSEFRFFDITVEGRPPVAPGSSGSGEMGSHRLITPGYFPALGIPLVRGRNFTEQERNGAVSEAILSRLLAERLFPGEDPLGRRIQLGGNVPWSTVVGIAADVKNNGLTEPTQLEIYTLRRNTERDWMGHTPVLLVDSVLPAPAVAAWMRQQLAAIDPTVPITVETMRRAVGNLAERPRFEAALVALFAICGLLLSAIGLYGVLAFLASQRTQEIGIRMALGATRLDALRLVAGEGLRLTLLGSLAGLAAAFGSVRLIRSLLYQVAPYDPSLYIAAVAVLALVAMAATLIPARRAASVEPMTALRHE